MAADWTAEVRRSAHNVARKRLQSNGPWFSFMEIISPKCPVASFTPQNSLITKETDGIIPKRVFSLCDASSRPRHVPQLLFNRNQSHPWYMELDQPSIKRGEKFVFVWISFIISQSSLAIQIGDARYCKGNSELKNQTTNISCFDELHYWSLLFIPRSIMVELVMNFALARKFDGILNSSQPISGNSKFGRRLSRRESRNHRDEVPFTVGGIFTSLCHRN